jgi:predicted nucleotidyltransferase
MAKSTELREPSGDLETVRRIVTTALRGQPARVFLFGSRARGDHRGTSDFDVAVLATHPLPRGLLGSIREELEESLVPVPVDLVDLAEASVALREHVLREGREWIVSEAD